MSLTARADMQQVKVTLRVLYRPKESALRTICLEMGMSYADKIFQSIGNEVLKAIVAQFDAGELITQREVVSMRVRETLVKRAAEFGLNLDDVAIVRNCTMVICSALGCGVRWCILVCAR